MKRILVVGANRAYSIERIYIKYLRKFGAEVSHFPAQEYFYEEYKSTLSKVIFKLGLSPIYPRINKRLKHFVEQSKPDVIWVFKGMEVFPGTLRWMKNRKYKIINYNPDNPFLFSGKGSGNKNVTQSIGLYDLHFTYQQSIKERLETDYKARVSILPFGYDAEEISSATPVNAEIKEVCFLGNPDKERQAFIISLADAGIPLAVYGHGWDKLIRHSNIKVFDAAYGKEQLSVLQKYRVQLNIMRSHNLLSHNMRTFEVPGAGGIMLAPETPEHLTFFEHGKEAFFYKNLADCVRIINMLLQLSSEEATAIRQAAIERSITSGYSYESRAKYALDEIQNLIG